MTEEHLVKMVDQMIETREARKTELEKEIEALKVEAIRAEAIKEFAERLKNFIETNVIIDRVKHEEMLINHIDNLVKEMVGERE